MRSTWGWLLGALIVTACTTSATATPVPAEAPAPVVAVRCDLPVGAGHLVLVVHRDVIPIGAEIVREEAQVTVDGTCAAGTECAHVDGARLRGLAALVRAASPLHHREVGTSPHYGFRSITARWDGGTCTLADGINAPIVDADSPAFYAAFDGIANAVVSARPDAGTK